MRRLWILPALLVFLAASCSDDTGPQDTCGNGTCDEGETSLSCPKDCGCNNDILNEGEQCDGELLGGKTCQDLGYEGGTLACTDRCTFDTSGCTGGSVCGNGVKEGREECDGLDLGDVTCQDLGYDGGPLGCDLTCQLDTTSCCHDACDVEGDTRCRGNTLETCALVETGCLAWRPTENCETRQGACEETDQGAVCRYPCRDRCANEGDLRCNGDVLEVCRQLESPDCLDAYYDWEISDDCAARGEYCREDNGTPQCVPPPPGDNCAEAIQVTQYPFQISGQDMAADYTNQYNFSNNDGCTTGRGPEVFFVVELTEGQRLHLSETGDVDAVLRVLETCDASAICLFSRDFGEDDQTFTAPADGTYYVVLEAYSSGSGDSYDFTLDLEVQEQDCTNGTDDDNDGLTDCEDRLDCCGDPACTTDPICLGDSCASPTVVDQLPFHISGQDITADYGDDYDFSSNTDCGTARGVEAVFAVYARAGETIKLSENGSVDAVLRILADCNPTAACLLSQDFGETDVEYTVTQDATYFVILEAYSGSPSSTGYDFTIDVVPPEDCTNGMDDDRDGRTDCEDRSDCCDHPACTADPLCQGDSCQSPLVADPLPFSISGDDITADFSDGYDFSNNTGCGTANGPEAIIAVYAQAGETIKLSERGGLDAVIRILEDCSPSASCLVSQDFVEDNIEYTATRDGTYFVVLEAYSSSPGTTDYDFTVDVILPEDCTNGMDDDHDGLTDCQDSEDCCADAACSSTLYCREFVGFYEQYADDTTDPIDLQGYTITFVPDSSVPEGYTWTTAQDATDYLVPPGTGDVSTTLTLSDDDAATYPLSLMGNFNFYGTDYDTIYVSSNGYVTFDAESSSIYNHVSSDATDFMSRGPGLAVLGMDLNPSSSGTVTVDEFSDKVVITYDQVPKFSTSTDQSVQLILQADGTIVYAYKTIEYLQGLVAFTSGWGLYLPPETNFVP